jgi:hypothetical protein
MQDSGSLLNPILAELPGDGRFLVQEIKIERRRSLAVMVKNNPSADG